MMVIVTVGGDDDDTGIDDNVAVCCFIFSIRGSSTLMASHHQAWPFPAQHQSAGQALRVASPTWRVVSSPHPPCMLTML